LKRILQYILLFTTILVINILIWLTWSLVTDESNYIWNEVSEENKKIINKACSGIFWIKYYVWGISINLAIGGIFFFFKNIKWGALLLASSLLVYMTGNALFNKHLVNNYFLIYMHQSVSKEYMVLPIMDAGYDIGEYIEPVVLNRKMSENIRIYGIEGLGEISYTPAIKNLFNILKDKKEPVKIRLAAYSALLKFEENEVEGYLDNFREIILPKEPRLKRAIEKVYPY
jgi:hypothetical protein